MSKYYKNTKYLNWDRKHLGELDLTLTKSIKISGMKVNCIVIQANEPIRHYPGYGYSGLVVWNDITLPVVIGKQLARYLKWARQESDHDVYRIDFKLN